jgi:hypothetical protein
MISPSQRSLPTQDNITQKDGNKHPWIRTHDLSVQAIKTYGSDRAATGTGNLSPVGPNILIIILFSDTLNLCCSLRSRHPRSTQYEASTVITPWRKNPKIHHRIHNSSPPIPILSHIHFPMLSLGPKISPDPRLCVVFRNKH